MKNKPTYYEFFGLENFESDTGKIKKAYRSAALKHHPDRGGSDHMMQQVNEIFRVLTQHKTEYDKHIQSKVTREEPFNVKAYDFVYPSDCTDHGQVVTWMVKSNRNRLIDSLSLEEYSFFEKIFKEWTLQEFIIAENSVNYNRRCNRKTTPKEEKNISYESQERLDNEPYY